MGQMDIMFRVILLVVVLVSPFADSTTQYVTQNTKFGTLVGVEQTVKIGLGPHKLETTVNAFLGVPFAKPPLGNLRFRPPQTLDTTIPWVNRPASTFPNMCTQMESFNGITPSEDCLYLNIWTPSDATASSKLPVRVWIHGGSLLTGSGSEDSGKYLAAASKAIANSEKDVIIVGVQYRVGWLGFMYANTADAPGNTGLLDQYAAIKWVHDNIADFGGDPSAMSIFGESAGGFSVLMQTLTDRPKYFNSAIAQSHPDVDWGYSTHAQAMAKFYKLAVASGCGKKGDPVAGILTCFRAMDAKTLYMKFFMQLKTMPIVVDGDFFKTDPLTKLNNGVKNMPLMLGTTENEGTEFLVTMLPAIANIPGDPPTISKAQLQQGIGKALKTSRTDVIDHLIWMYNRNVNTPLTNLQVFALSVSDKAFTCPGNRVAEKFAQNGNKVYQYRLRQRPSTSDKPKWYGCAHADDLPFVFGLPLDQSSKYTTDERYLTYYIMQWWTMFALSNGDNMPAWPAYDTTNKQYMSLEVPAVKTGQKLQADTCSFWNKWKDIQKEIKNPVVKLNDVLDKYALPRKGKTASRRQLSSRSSRYQRLLDILQNLEK